MEDINVVVTSSGVKEVLTKEVVKALNEEASIYMKSQK